MPELDALVQIDLRKMDLGNILTIGIMLVTLGMGWQSISSVKDRMEEVYENMKAMTITVNAIQVKQAEDSQRVKSVEDNLKYLQQNGSNDSGGRDRKQQ